MKKNSPAKRRTPNFQYEVDVFVGLNHEPAYSQAILAQNREEAEREVLHRATKRLSAFATRIAS